MRLYLMRHGETDWNVKGMLQGRTDIPLNTRGEMAAELTKVGLKDVNFDIAFTSPLERAKRTAEIILTGKNTPIIVDERIVEIGFGKYEGMPKNKMDENIINFFKSPERYIPQDGGEKIEELLERERCFLDELIENKQYQDSTILVTTHGAALSGLLCLVKDWPISDFWKGGLHKNCGFSILEVKEKSYRILEEAVLAYSEKEIP